MTDNLIIVRGGAYVDVRRALKQWIDLYTPELKNGMTFQLIKAGRGRHVILADPDLNNEFFFYLVNYLKYPENINYKLDVVGYTRGKEFEKVKDKQLMVYISPNEDDFDSVFVVTTLNDHFKIDFGGNVRKIEDKRLFEYPPNVIHQNVETFVVKNAGNWQNERQIKITLEKRFKVFLVIFLALILAGFLIRFGCITLMKYYAGLISYGLFIWFLIEHNHMSDLQYYFLNVLVSITYVIFIFLIDAWYIFPLSAYLSLWPLFFLLFQGLFRQLYLIIFNKEPDIDPPSTLWERIYISILIFSTFILSMWIGYELDMYFTH